MPWGNYNSIILQYSTLYILLVEDMPWGGSKVGSVASGREGTQANREGLEKGSRRLSGLQIRHWRRASSGVSSGQRLFNSPLL